MVCVGLAQVSAVENREENIKKAFKFMKLAAEKGVNVICFPEMAFDIFFPQYRADKKYFDLAICIPGKLVSRFQEKAKELNLTTIINLYEESSPGEHYNTTAVIDSDGTLLGTSQMMHIAEIPNYNEKFYYWPGKTDYPVFQTQYAKIGISTCNDRHFPEQLRILALKGAELILVPSAVANPAVMDIWEIEVQAHSIFNQVYIGVVNRVGKEDQMNFWGRSFFTNPKGEVISRGGEEEELVNVEFDFEMIKEMRKVWPFFRDRRPETYKTILEK